MQPARVDDCASGFLVSCARVMEYAAKIGAPNGKSDVIAMAQHDARHRSLVRILARPVCACGTTFATTWNLRCEGEREWCGEIETPSPVG